MEGKGHRRPHLGMEDGVSMALGRLHRNRTKSDQYQILQKTGQPIQRSAQLCSQCHGPSDLIPTTSPRMCWEVPGKQSLRTSRSLSINQRYIVTQAKLATYPEIHRLSSSAVTVTHTIITAMIRTTTKQLPFIEGVLCLGTVLNAMHLILPWKQYIIILSKQRKGKALTHSYTTVCGGAV